MVHDMNKRISRRVTVKEIAQIAGVTSSAVSNWKRRHADFPRATESGTGGEFFDLEEVVEWLRFAGRGVMTTDNAETLLWKLFENLANELPREEALLVVLQILYVRRSLSRIQDNSVFDGTVEPKMFGMLSADTPTATRQLWDRVVEGLVADTQELQDVLRLPERVDDSTLHVSVMGLDAAALRFTDLGETVSAFLLRASNEVAGQASVSITPDAVSSLIRSLLEPINGSVYDPAAGYGLLLARLVEGLDISQVRLFGQEVSANQWRIAYLHLALREVPFTLAQGDTIRGDRFHDLRADRVVLDGPMGGKLDAGDQLLDERWRYGFASTADWMWVQHVLYHLHPDGIGAVLVPTGCLSRAGREAHIRHGIVGDGRLHAVIELPPKMLPGFSLSVSLLLLRGAASLTHGSHVLFVDARQLGQTRRGKTHELSAADVGRITAAVRATRQGAHVNEPLFAAMADPIRIESESFDLTPSRYIRYTDTRAPADDAEVHANVKRQIAVASHELNGVVPYVAKVSVDMQRFHPAAETWPLRTLKTLLLDAPRPGTRQDANGGGTYLPWIPTSAVSSAKVVVAEEPTEFTRGRPPARLAQHGDLLLVARGVGSSRSIGCAVVELPYSCAFAESLLLLVPDRTVILPDFLRLALVSASGYTSLVAVTSGSVISNIRPDALGGVEIRVPDLPTQQRIVDAVRGLEEAQEQMNAAARALRDMAQTFRNEIAEGRYTAGPATGMPAPNIE